MSYSTALSFDLSPVRLSYVAALRGVLPKKPSDPFTYAQTGVYDLDALLCLAASNPQGAFYGLTADASKAQSGTQAAALRKVTNITFVTAADQLPQGLDYLICEKTDALPDDADRESLFALAQERLRAGGLLAYRYRAYQSADDALRFLIAEYAPEMTPAQAKEFLTEIKALGTAYFAEHAIARDALSRAMDSGTPDAFFQSCGDCASSRSGTFAVMEGLLPRGFSFAGDADVGANYLELAAPKEAHETLGKCREQLLYEPIKDFALGRTIRNDIWVKQPAEQTLDPAALFGHFTFGITTARERLPATYEAKGGSLSLQTPLFTRLIDLMCMLPTSIGDFLAHPAGFGMQSDDVVSAIHVLVACGFAQPMRAHYEAQNKVDIETPAWASSFNEYLSTEAIEASTIRLASPIVGGAMTLSAREALVLQAISRVGLANSAGSLQPVLKTMIEKNPALAAQVMESTDPTDEVVHNMIASSVTTGLVRWYAYGLLAA